MNIAVIGSGYVGLVTGACFAEFGVNVTCVDKEEAKIAALKKGIIPIYEPGLEELVKKNVQNKRLSFSTNTIEAIQGALVIFIAVGTPDRGDGFADLSYIETVAETIAEHMNGYKVIVTKSTVPVGTGDRLRSIIGSKQKEHFDFDIVSNPEFLREGSAIEDFLRPNRVVIGANSQQAVAIMRDLYRPLYLIETPLLITDIPTAEMIKYASNAFLATKISFINEIANLCEGVGANVQDVARGMGLDGRIGSKFLHPGPGFGGSCFPKDVSALSQIAQKNGYEFKIVKAVIEVNRQQRERMIAKIEKEIGNLKGKQIGILGLSFKPNTDDMREAPSVAIIRALQERGAKIIAHDPAAMEEAKKVLKEVTYAADPYTVADGSDAIILMTEWNPFRNLDLDQIKKKLKAPVFVDLRNVYEPKKMAALGFKYTSVGRPS
ncbi:MAG: UDP-glucose/GDP-mannose dehydrogenase family protein [Candidatus Manganitrophus sp.]|jgi:UDPglucose 6-dehydrogenase|nr:UDP-glucose/GDP-mannose dehydrogenase family protein [Candidatus Manganitrophus sp.]MDC4223173.1 UDP-glucose/GDP-mannose dehydrogenase family protein [Candidatus Manganitrophus sp.]WDT69466.1 MAG: UDP-glucose/GDP-mannose dehydrogenase family protein [Candidatus Manganitrophus sp.]WDT78946.1 MAG: UDP-glucose/GDP-mannose dehydrogenase family protein [Candidatus Manganitrophus sp.]